MKIKHIFFIKVDIKAIYVILNFYIDLFYRTTRFSLVVYSSTVNLFTSKLKLFSLNFLPIPLNYNYLLIKF